MKTNRILFAAAALMAMAACTDDDITMERVPVRAVYVGP